MTLRFMAKHIQWVLVIGGVALAAAMIIFAPDEKTLGAGIKYVYIHVAMTWTGMTGLALMALLGVVAFIRSSEKLQSWSQMIGWAGVLFLAAGFFMSTVAAGVNWNGMFLDEPRTRMIINVMLLTLVVQIVNQWLPYHRVKGLFSAVPVVFMMVSLWTTDLVLHPQSPILSSDSRGIQFTFIGLFAIFSAITGWVVWRIQRMRSG